ncbi:hypothetical protein [Hypericibacter sp.]|uniref:hypothetical protein n=1 Tax=Hypericibacter sp. TaxID=2705401 RepID=UPI003D6CACBD
MFVLDAKRIVKWPVDVDQPVDGGGTETRQFTAHFQLLPQSEIDAVFAGNGTDATLLNQVLVGWGGITIEDGGEIRFDEIRRAALVDIPYVRRGLMRAYIACISGVKRKNSVTPSATGRAATDAETGTKSKPT